jgi:hypothetical protein
MAKVNKLALARLALRYCIKDLSREEKLCILTDMFCPLRDGVRWFGHNGYGVGGLDQGIYGHMTTFRRISDLWLKLEGHGGKRDEEMIIIRNLLLGELSDEDREEILGVKNGIADEPIPEFGERRPPAGPEGVPRQGELKLAVNYSNSSNGPYAPPENAKGGFSV